MASNQEKFMQEIVEGVKGATASSLKMLSGLEQLAKNNFDNLKENEAIEVNKILKDNSVFENLNKAKKDLENLLGGK
jgi:ATP-dependent protease HslVU (ClpYQ) peptidase subunit